ncbi:MAG: PEP-CTERM sorting domain-containing protein [Deltaproteobacteria bacterium]|nr:PEP-CTERM sorting domain-containing protein [Deltaproteobacteria bacterium]MBW2414295.1 PEP-CTERM sorting domain-containing protein [Deltaproteobacteria bacterium]
MPFSPLASHWFRNAVSFRNAVWFRNAVAALLVASGATLAAPSQASTLILSDTSNEAGVPAEWMDAEVTFGVSGSTLTVTLLNTTVSPSGFDVTDLNFNSSGDIDGLDILSATGADGDNLADWGFEGGVSFAPYGVFDWGVFALIQGNHPSHVVPGETQTFTFAIDCDAGATCDDSDFVREFSRFGSPNAQIAALFRNGPDDASARGAFVPEPATAALLFAALGALAYRRRSG